jgi:non-specific serine/threonine protein kinase/serine/threonine-protein kinase
VLQYELITGVLPFDPERLRAGGFDEICRRIREEEPSRPSVRISGVGEAASRSASLRGVDAGTLHRLLLGDLDWVTMKALEKDPERRYGSPQELADDLHRYLRHEPVLASPPSAAYRLRKFVRRNRLAVAAASAVLVAVIGGAVVAAVFAVREAAERRRAERARADLEKVVAFQSRMISGVDPQGMGARLLADLRRRGGETGLSAVQGTDAALRILDEEILDRAARVIETEFATEPLIEARLRASLAETYLLLGLPARAAPHIRRAIELRGAALGPRAAATLEARLILAGSLTGLGRFDEAEAAHREALEDATNALGADDPVTLRAKHGLGNFLKKGRARYDEAESILLATLESRRRVLGPEALRTVDTMEALADVYDLTGRASQAQPLLVEAVSIREREMGPDDPFTLRSRMMLANVTVDVGRLGEAEEQIEDLIERLRRVRGSDHRDVCAALSDLGRVYSLQSRHDEATAAYRDAYEIALRTHGPDHLETIAIGQNLATGLMDSGRMVEAEALFEACIEGLTRSGGPDHHATLLARNNLGIVHHRTGRYRDAARTFRATAENPRATPDVKAQAAAYFMEPSPSKDTALSVRYATEAVEATRRGDVSSLRILAIALERDGRIPEARSVHEEVVALPGAGARHLNSYAWFLLTRMPGDPASASTALAHALRANELSGHKNPDYLDTLALAYHRTGRSDKAVETVERALALLAPGDEERRAPFVERLEEYRGAARPR